LLLLFNRIAWKAAPLILGGAIALLTLSAKPQTNLSERHLPLSRRPSTHITSPKDCAKLFDAPQNGV
jgi:hypothetical protein